MLWLWRDYAINLNNLTLMECYWRWIYFSCFVLVRDAVGIMKGFLLISILSFKDLQWPLWKSEDEKRLFAYYVITLKAKGEEVWWAKKGSNWGRFKMIFFWFYASDLNTRTSPKQFDIICVSVKHCWLQFNFLPLKCSRWKRERNCRN